MNDLIRLQNAAGDHATISLYGGQVLSWQTAAGASHLYQSPLAVSGDGRAIRAGIPVCFPQFSGWGNLLKHGFARSALWRQEGSAISGAVDSASLRLVLEDDDALRAVWPHAFCATLEVTLANATLEVALTVRNTGAAAFSFTAALHTYLACDDVRTLTLTGLEQTPYLDATDNNRPTVAAVAPLTVSAEIDRIYPAAAPRLLLQQDGRPFLHIEQQGFADSVIWNPGPEKAAALDDMPDQDWLRMFCIEAAQILDAIELAPGASWNGSQRLSSMQG